MPTTGSARPTQHDDGTRIESVVPDDDDQIDEAVEEDENGGFKHGDQQTAADRDSSDRDSDILSEIDEDRSDRADEEDERPVEIDEDAVKTLRAAKRKRPEKTGTTTTKKKATRPKKRSRVASAEAEDGGEDTGKAEGHTHRREKSGRRFFKEKSPEKEQPREEDLPPEERRRRAIERAINTAVKKPSKRRKKDEMDLEQEVDEEIASLKVKMENACIADNAARDEERPAVRKLQVLPQVLALLHRTAIQAIVLDPDTNFMLSVRYFLEPLNDGSLPAYSIQRDLLSALVKLPINKETLISSGIGKVVLFYTRSKCAEPAIKRMAERLVGEWSRPILKRTDDYKKRHIETRAFDYSAAKFAQRQEAATGMSQLTVQHRPRHQVERERLLAPDNKSRRSRPLGLAPSYTVAPQSTFDGSRAPEHFRPIGAAGSEAFRKMTHKKNKN